jgi:hypothetical protein
LTTALGLIGIAFFIACVIALAAGVTYTVVKIVPAESRRKRVPPAETSGS